MIILAVDSGIEKTGYAFFDKSLSNIKLISSGLIKTNKSLSHELRLRKIYYEIENLSDKYKPNTIILERIFFFKNQKTIVSVLHAQGILLLLAAKKNLKVEFLTPLQIKEALTGYGRADKKAVQKMISLTIKLDKPIIQDDEADAVACGLAYCYLKRNTIK